VDHGQSVDPPLAPSRHRGNRIPDIGIIGVGEGSTPRSRFFETIGMEERVDARLPRHLQGQHPLCRMEPAGPPITAILS
jgi:hypothetical protein